MFCRKRLIKHINGETFAMPNYIENKVYLYKVKLLQQKFHGRFQNHENRETYPPIWYVNAMETYVCTYVRTWAYVICVQWLHTYVCASNQSC